MNTRTAWSRALDTLSRPSATGWIALLCTTVALRSYHIFTLPPGLFMDEARNLTEISAFREHGVFYWRDSQPLFHLVAAQMTRLFGYQAVSLRLTSALFGIVAVPALYLFAARVWGRRVGWLAAWLLAGSAWHIIFSRIGLRAITLPLFVCLTGWAFTLAIQRRNTAAWLLLGLVLGLGWFTYFSYLLIPPCALALLVYMGMKQGWRGRQLATGLAVACGFLLLAVVLWRLQRMEGGGALPLRLAVVSTISRPFGPDGPVMNAFRVLWMFSWKGTLEQRYNVPGWTAWPQLLLPFLVLGIGAAAASRRIADRALVGLWVVMLLPTVFSNEAPSHVRTLGAVVPTAILSAQGLLAAAQWLRPRRARLAAAVVPVFTTAAVAMGAYTYFGAYAHRPELAFAYQVAEKELAEHLDATVPREQPIVVLNLIWGRETARFLLRHRDAHFYELPPGLPVPARILDTPRPATWVFLLEADRRQLEASRGPLTLLETRPISMQTALICRDATP